LRKSSAFFITGGVCLAFSIGFFTVVFQNWVFPGLPTGNWISRESAVITIYYCLLSDALGIIGGFLIGKYLKKVFEID